MRQLQAQPERARQAQGRDLAVDIPTQVLSTLDRRLDHPASLVTETTAIKQELNRNCPLEVPYLTWNCLAHGSARYHAG